MKRKRGDARGTFRPLSACLVHDRNSGDGGGGFSMSYTVVADDEPLTLTLRGADVDERAGTAAVMTDEAAGRAAAAAGAGLAAGLAGRPVEAATRAAVELVAVEGSPGTTGLAPGAAGRPTTAGLTVTVVQAPPTCGAACCAVPA